MSWGDRVTVDILTDASGDFEGFTPVVNGFVWQYRYVPDGSNPLDTGADLDITGDTSGMVYANQDNIGTSAFEVFPRAAADGVDGAELSGGGGTMLFACGERLKVVIANGGNAKQGKLHIWLV